MIKYNNYFLHIIPFILVFFWDDLILDFILDDDNRPQIAIVYKVLIFLYPIVSVLFLRIFKQPLKYYFFFLVFYLIILVFESLYKHGTFIVYPHVFEKVVQIFVLFFFYGFYKTLGIKIEIKHIAVVIIVLALLSILTVNQSVFSLSAVQEIDRGLDAFTNYLLLLPLLFFLNRFLLYGELKYLLFTIFAIGLVIFLQYRTVWASMIFCIPLNIFLVKVKCSNTLRFSKNLAANLIITGSMFVTMSVVIYLSILYFGEEYVNHVEDRFEDLINPEKEGSTSSWRLEQIESYAPYVKENIIDGMRFEGFELPIQFYNDVVDMPVFADMTGHHFHNQYLDTLFYFGIIGLFFYVIPILILFVFMVFNKKKYDINTITLASFIFSILVFGFAWWYPQYIFALTGYLLVLMENQKSNGELQYPNSANHF